MGKHHQLLGVSRIRGVQVPAMHVGPSKGPAGQRGAMLLGCLMLRVPMMHCSQFRVAWMTP
jgi:hypothetical protein